MPCFLRTNHALLVFTSCVGHFAALKLRMPWQVRFVHTRNWIAQPWTIPAVRSWQALYCTANSQNLTVQGSFLADLIDILQDVNATMRFSDVSRSPAPSRPLQLALLPSWWSHTCLFCWDSQQIQPLHGRICVSILHPCQLCSSQDAFVLFTLPYQLF
jgi:hypothetical protein